ncbi:unnamed protein product [Closterium sp. NIES-64]|nr:unnamed protein product [Closterium sp. NIES-64]
MALGLRLGMELPVAEVCPCKRDNATIADKSLPNHLLRCGDGGDAVRTHHALVFAALRMARDAGYKTFHETTAFSPPVLRKRADLAIRDQESGETWVTDVTVTDPVLQRRDKGARKPPGWAAEEASEGKHRLYEGRPSYSGFFGLAVETYGALAKDTQQFIRLLANYAAKTKYRKGRLTTTAARLNAHFRQRWSVVLQRSQAISLLSKSNRAAEAAFPQTAADPWAPRLGGRGDRNMVTGGGWVTAGEGYMGAVRNRGGGGGGGGVLGRGGPEGTETRKGVSGKVRGSGGSEEDKGKLCGGMGGTGDSWKKGGFSWP